MNSHSRLHLPPQHARSGIALVITLLLLVLLSAFAVAFFTRMNVEQVSASSYADGVTTRQLAESAVGVVQSQIREATTITAANGHAVAWASQPGMIRTFAKRGAATPQTGKDNFAFYKLYSSDDMTITDANKMDSFDPLSEIDDDWRTNRALWTDLNEPVRLKITDPDDQDSEIEIKRYPIFDPDLADKSNTNNPATLSIHDTTNNTKIEGFSIDQSNGKTDQDRANMPVRWIYVLRDGSLTAPSGSKDEGLIATWDSGGGIATVPTKANPIVGRIAFWTDDDTSKVNINTAGGFTTKGIDPNIYDPRNDRSYSHFPGSFWDTPRFFTAFDRGGDIDDTKFGEPKVTSSLGRNTGFSLALAQPVANEFQRFPGHPATTSLGLVFNRTLRSDGTVDATTPRLTAQQLYRLLPRLRPGGTEGGADRQIVFNNTGAGYQNAPSDKKMPLKAQRLYSSVDEFFFAAAQTGNRRQSANDFLRTPDPSDPRNPIPAITEDLIGENDLDEFQAYRFFLTAHSRAPELNLYGRPRISVWPVWANEGTYAARRNPIDRLLMFCSTLGPTPPVNANGGQPVGKLFQFQRYQPYRPETDVNIARNTFLLKTYLTGSSRRPGLTDLPVPGFTDTETFATKYNGGDNIGSRDQIIAQIFDYIRSGVNLRDTYYDRDYMGRTLTAIEQQTRDLQRYAPRGVVIPAGIKFPDSKITAGGKEVAGFGRFPTVSEVSIVFYHAGYKDLRGQYYWDPREKATRGVTAHLMRMFLAIETYNPMQGYARPEDTSRDDRNTTPDRLQHLLQISLAPAVIINSPAGGPAQTTTFQLGEGGGLLSNEIRIRSGAFSNGSDAAGMEGILHGFGRKYQLPTGDQPGITAPPYPGSIGWAPPADNNTGHGVYPFQSSNFVEMPLDPRQGRQLGETFRFNGMEARLRVRFGAQELQFIDLKFPAADLPVPTDAYWEDPGGFAFPNPDVLPRASTFQTTWAGSAAGSPWACALMTSPNGVCNPAAMKHLAYRIWWINEAWNNLGGGRAVSFNPYSKFNSQGQELFDNAARGFTFANHWRNIIQAGDVVRSLVPTPVNNPDIRVIALQRAANGDALQFSPLPDYNNPTVRHVQRLDQVTSGKPAAQTQLLRGGSGAAFIFSGTTNLSPVDGNGNISATAACSVEPIPGDGQIRSGRQVFGWERKTYGLVGTHILFGNLAQLPSLNATWNYATRAGDLPALGGTVNGVKRSDGNAGDFDTGIGFYPDGSLVNKPDEGHLIWRRARTDLVPAGRAADPAVSNDWWYRYPYYISEFNDEPTDTFFSPNRQMPSPAMFGSLLAGAKTGWQTLCFSPNPASLPSAGKNADGSPQTKHPGFDQNPKDHLLLDLFTMPVVEPYAISEPFSTAGKINLNCEIMPFSYIHRTTALRAALHGMRLTAVEADQVKLYKSNALSRNFRLQLNRDETIKGIVSRFNDTSRPPGDRFFKSASQICEHFLYPALASDGKPTGDLPGPKWNRNETEIRTFWQNNNLGGDNVREKPYADLYPRLTTKSNTYTVHLRVQKLRPQTGRADQDFLEWKETEDAVAAEYRGEVQIERYLDPQDRRFDPSDPTVAPADQFDVDATVFRSTLTNTRPLEHAYRFRTVGSKRFSPDR